jgi:hypothetical protein
MAPDLALAGLSDLKKGSLVLDPMAGSGTVLRQAVDLGHSAIGFDVDPLAVLMSKVWTRPVDPEVFLSLGEEIITEAQLLDLRTAKLPWLKEDPETAEFIKYWFAPEQRRALHRIAFVLHSKGDGTNEAEGAALDVLRLALSRIIVTKEQAASLARDTSHSRPHKVSTTSTFDVFGAYRRSVDQLHTRLSARPPLSGASVKLGDARRLDLRDATVDAVMTSPPYLNAIDYLRGHRMSLVWLGHRLKPLRDIRSSSIGAERGADENSQESETVVDAVTKAMTKAADLHGRHESMVRRYATDLVQMTREVGRVLKPGGRATFVVGDSCLKGSFITNSAGVAAAATSAGLRQISITKRDLPASSRYLPINDTGALGKRMREEIVLTFSK